MTLDELLTQLKGLKYTCKLFGESEQLNVIQPSEFYQVENLIRQFALDNHDKQIGVLKAKVYTYEQVISKSTFAPLFNFKEDTNNDKNNKWNFKHYWNYEACRRNPRNNWEYKKQSV